MLADLRNFIRKVDNDVYPSEAYSGYKWVFTPDMIPNSRKLHDVPSDALIKEYEEKLLKHTIDLLNKDKEALKLLMAKVGRESDFESERKKIVFLNKLEQNLKAKEFFGITKFEHIVKKND